MNFSTQIPISKSNLPIDYHSKMILLGSCFAENIGEKFQYFKFQTDINPFGILFNPVSLEILIRRVVQQNYFTEEDVFYHNDLWHCFEVHSEFSNPDKETFLMLLNQKISSTHIYLQTASHCFVTLGTSWVYRNLETNAIVANCHKVPQNQFAKELLSVNQVQASLESMIKLVHAINPACHFVFTVSPVRHLKDGYEENTLSKAHLIAGLPKLFSKNGMGYYFPSYEIMMDELRDYRFYADDMLHPSTIAIEYIWEKLTQTFMTDATLAISKEVNKLQKAIAHRPIHSTSESYLAFSKKLNLERELFLKKFPFIRW